MADHRQCALSVSDVYETAVAIGREFQQTIDLYGAATVDKLLPKVQRALEQLEMLAEASEHSSLEIGGMRIEVDGLKGELEREKRKTGQEAEDVKEVVGNLERENRALRARLDETVGSKSADNADVQGDDDDDGAAAREIEESLQKLSLRLLGSSDQLKSKDREIALKNEDILALESQIKRLAGVNQNLRREVALVKARYQTLNEAKAAVELQLEVARQATTKAEEELQRRAEEQSETSEGTEISCNADRKDSTASMANKKNDDNDNADVNRPRFTLEELRSVITDRNDWKIKAEELQEEIDFLKQSISPDVDIEWPEDEDSKRREMLKEPQRRSSTSTSQRCEDDRTAEMALDSMEMKTLKSKADVNASGVKQIFQAVGEVGHKNGIQAT